MLKTLEINSLANLSDTVKDLLQIIGLKATSNELNCVAFYGEMGAGKTTIIKEICKLLRVIDITSSPSFSLINEYITKEEEKIYHFDFYRINKKEEVYDLGYEEYFYGNNLCLIEWPEKIESFLPIPYYRVDIIVHEDGKRRLEIKKIT